MVTTRACSNGHAVAEDYLKVCPKCGATLIRPDHEEKPPSLAPATDEPVAVPRTVPFIVGGIVLALFGTLLTYAAERGPAEVFGFVLIALAVVLVLVGLADAVRRRP
jgi:small neutral amino acid transporter SnatA (MarC family)